VLGTVIFLRLGHSCSVRSARRGQFESSSCSWSFGSMILVRQSVSSDDMIAPSGRSSVQFVRRRRQRVGQPKR
jgi:hypothetical protein